MKKVAFVTYKESADLSDSDQLLVAPMAEQGYKVVPVPWDDTSVTWTEFSCVVFRSCWNYHYNTNKFSQWLALLEKQKVKTWNPLEIIKWNIDKSYLQDLKERFSVNIIPTIYIKKGDSSNLEDIVKNSGWLEVVVKPCIGSSAYKIFKTTIAEAPKYQQDFSDILSSTNVMVQPLIPELVQNGEISMVFLNKIFSHAINRKPKQGEFRSNFRFGGIESRAEPSKAMINDAQDILDNIDSVLLYARVDGIMKDGKFMLMELELIEPYLFFNLDRESPIRFAEAFNDLSQKPTI